MVKLISNRIENYQVVSPQNRAYTSGSVKKEHKEEIPKSTDKKVKSWKDMLAPLGLVAGGGILLYYGIKTPGKVKLFKNNIKSRLFQMEAELGDYNSFVKKTVDMQFGGVARYIQEYKQQRFPDISNFISNIKMLQNPKLISNINDLAFLTVAKSDVEVTRPGASDIGNFSVIVDQAVREASKLIDGKKYKSRMVMNDYVHVPKFKDGKHSDLMESAENQLIAMSTSISQQMETVKNEKLHIMIKANYKKMAEIITNMRQQRTASKENVIEATFEKLSSLLKLENFVPSYNKIPTLENYEKLTYEQLKPSSIPKSIEDMAKNNIYLSVIKSKDFNNFNDLNDRDVYEIFYRSPYNNNLKDLGFLIDRIRVKQAIANSLSETAESDNLNIIIAKLEYLSNKLHKVGSEELIKKCQKDFNKMTLGQRQAALYYVTTVSRRLGFDTIKDMDKYFAEHNDIYKTLNIRDYIEIFDRNPDLYFV